MIFQKKYNRRHWFYLGLAILTAAGAALLAPACSSMGGRLSDREMEIMKKSPNFRDGRFVNRLPVDDPQLFQTLKEWFKGSGHTVPKEPVPIVKRVREDFAQLPSSGLRLTWIGHSTTLVEIDGVRLLLDPIWSQRSSPFSWAGPKRFFDPPLSIGDLPPIDAVLISHDHYDHLDMSTVVTLAGTGVHFLVPLGVGVHLMNWGIPAASIDELDWWETAEVKSVTVTSTPARHFSGRSLLMLDRDRTLWSGYAMSGPEHRVYYSGDTGMFPGFAEIGSRLGPFDASLVEVGAYHRLWADLHLGPEQAVQAVRDVRGGMLIPVHWGTFDLALHSWVEPAERLIAAATQDRIPLAVPRPGQSVEPSSPPPLVRWWPDIPWQTAEEHPVLSSGSSAR